MDDPGDALPTGGTLATGDSEAPPRLRGGVSAALGAAALVGGFWYLAVLGTESQMMPLSLLLGWAVGAVMTRVARRHGFAYSLYAVAITGTAVLTMIFFVQRQSLNNDPRNHIPAWANPTIIADVFSVGFSAWPIHYLWLAAAVGLSGFVGARGPHRQHPMFVRLYHTPRLDQTDRGEQ